MVYNKKWVNKTLSFIHPLYILWFKYYLLPEDLLELVLEEDLVDLEDDLLGDALLLEDDLVDLVPVDDGLELLLVDPDLAFLLDL